MISECCWCNRKVSNVDLKLITTKGEPIWACLFCQEELKESSVELNPYVTVFQTDKPESPCTPISFSEELDLFFSRTFDLIQGQISSNKPAPVVRRWEEAGKTLSLAWRRARLANAIQSRNSNEE